MPKILIVDDRRDAIEVLQAKLQKRGFVTESSVDARDISKICEAQVIDAIVMDMNMPELDGCEATEVLKSNPATANIPVIMCTAHPLAGDKERASQAGCDGFVEKPIHLNTLMQILGQFFEVGPEETENERIDKPEVSEATQTAELQSPATIVQGGEAESVETTNVDSPSKPTIPSPKILRRTGRPAVEDVIEGTTSQDS